MEETSKVNTNIVPKSGMNTDINSSFLQEDIYSYARNTIKNTDDGDLGTKMNEQSTEKCWEAPYKVIGLIKIPNNEVLVFSTDNISSEIGVGNNKTCQYRTLVNLPCLNFRQDKPITGVSKLDFNKHVVATFTDKFNPLRRIDINTIGAVTNCDDALLFKKVTFPCISVHQGAVGNIPNGMYSVAIAYTLDGQIFTNFTVPTVRTPLFSRSNSNALSISLTDLDKGFDEFAVVLIGSYVDPITNKATKTAKQVGTYSTKTTSIIISDFINDDYPTIPLSNIIVEKVSWKTAGIVSANSNYLLVADLVGYEEENYQIKALDIKAKYVIKQVPGDYYEKGGQDIGLYRDENYDFSIRGVRNTGERTSRFYIPGRLSTSTDMAPVSTADVYELDKQFTDCNPLEKIPKWKVENTAGIMIPTNAQFTCDERILGRGEFGYHQSTELLPDNKFLFGDLANTNITYHKTPDEAKVPRYSIVEGREYINIIGVEFSNIPKFTDPSIVGYEILRSDRKGGNGTVVARGLMTNMRSYIEQSTNEEVFYANYPINDLRPDSFLSSTQTTLKNRKENNFTPLVNYHANRFNFYSPHTFFEPRYTLGNEIKIESEEIADIKGKFETVFNHPRQKLLTQFSFWIAAAIGFIESSLVLIGGGNRQVTTNSGESLGINANTNSNVSTTDEYPLRNVDDLMSFDLISYITGLIVSSTGVRAGAANAGKINKIIQIIGAALTIIASLAVKIPYSIFKGIEQANQVIKIIDDFTSETDYTYQYGAHAKFVRQLPVLLGQKRRRLLYPATYLANTLLTVDGLTINNIGREQSVYLHLNKEVGIPVTLDNSRQTIKEFGVCTNPTQDVFSVGSAFYSTSKVINPNQYGQLGSTNQVVTHNCVLKFSEESETTTSPIIFGGDCIITRFAFQKKMRFFSQDLANTNYPNNVEYDYRKYRSVAYPRFWLDSTKYDFSELLSSNVMNYAKFSRTTEGKYNLDCLGNDKKAPTRVDNAYMYLYNNAILDFYVESDYNTDYREESDTPFFSKSNMNLSEIFRSDRLNIPEEFNINRAYSDLYTTEVFSPMIRDDYDPENPIPETQPNSVIYSLPSFNLQNIDNWQYFLPNNFFSFRESDFGYLTAIHKIDQDRVIFLFSDSSPYISMGRDFLELEQSGRKITVGDGGLFAQDPREIMPTDNNYGACTSRFAFSNTHLGRFFPSQVQGRILNFTESLEDITRQGVFYWCKKYMPIQLYDFFPNYLLEENPVSGVGYLTVFDPTFEILYITKRDFIPKPEFRSTITYNNGEFKVGDRVINIRDEFYFQDISWTLSYDPIEKGFISYHDWHPDLICQLDKHFLTIKGNSSYLHNKRYDSFCEFYDKKYPFEIEYVSNTGQVETTLRSIEYKLDAFTYKNYGRDRFNILNQNFDLLIVRNNEQISPLLRLEKSSLNPEDNILFPKKFAGDNVSMNIIFDKEENKYRINKFWDATKDRGEFTNNEFHLYPTDASGYKNVINPIAIDRDKPEEERKKFRSSSNKIRLIKSESNNIRIIFKLSNTKTLISPR